MSTLTPQLSYLIRHDVLQATIINALLIGLYTAVVVFTFHRIFTERSLKTVQLPLIACMLVMYACAIVNLAMRWNLAKEAYVDDGKTELTVVKSLLGQRIVVMVVAAATRGLTMLIADGIMIWRCWKLYAKSWLVIALPLVLLCGELVSLILTIVWNARRQTATGSSTPGLKFLITNLSFTLATTVLLTLLIIYRIVHMGSAKRYQRIIEIIVESAALYALTIVIYMPFPLQGPSSGLTDTIPNVFLTPVAGLASTLIIARVIGRRGIENVAKKTAAKGLIVGSGSNLSTFRARSNNDKPETWDEEATTGLGANSLPDSYTLTNVDKSLRVGSHPQSVWQR